MIINSMHHQDMPSGAPKRIYHHRSESHVLRQTRTKRPSLHRKRSRTATDQYSAQYPAYVHPARAASKELTRHSRIVSIPELNPSEMQLPFGVNHSHTGLMDIDINIQEKRPELSVPSTSQIDNDQKSITNQISYHIHNDYYTQQLQDLVRQFRQIVLPLQTEINSLRQITKDLKDEVRTLQRENSLMRRQKYDYTNRYSPNGTYTNATTVNPAYLFQQQHDFRPVKSYGTVATATTLDTFSASNVNTNGHNHNHSHVATVHDMQHLDAMQARMARESMQSTGTKGLMDEEDELEIQGGNTSQLQVRATGAEHLDVCDPECDAVDILATTPATPVSTPRGIDQTYNDFPDDEQQNDDQESSVSTMSRSSQHSVEVPARAARTAHASHHNIISNHVDNVVYIPSNPAPSYSASMSGSNRYGKNGHRYVRHTRNLV